MKLHEQPTPLTVSTYPRLIEQPLQLAMHSPVLSRRAISLRSVPNIALLWLLAVHLHSSASAAPISSITVHRVRQEPTPPERETWAIRNMSRVCSVGDNLCEWNFVIDTSPPSSPGHQGSPADHHATIAAAAAALAGHHESVEEGKSGGDDVLGTSGAGSRRSRRHHLQRNNEARREQGPISILDMLRVTITDAFALFYGHHHDIKSGNNNNTDMQDSHDGTRILARQHTAATASKMTAAAALLTPCRHLTYSDPGQGIPASRATTTAITTCGAFRVTSGWTRAVVRVGNAATAAGASATGARVSGGGGGGGGGGGFDEIIAAAADDDDDDDGFTVLSVVDAARGVLVWPAYSDSELLSAAAGGAPVGDRRYTVEKIP
ncbi:uncharacterized protein B0I36DRAFT_30955 [Microdochium trichocladiopsis]|uniref:Uncharacterized protein n=1 Tax=Microdochium trichocladiopsis TaxID=1682393 RepID=A0A9P8XW61_9PEZI|nr:uncharacterized protein B0I36DRAFT_30955 [Microdochium trichocladiopsis]KAH7021290.1 hypothetical protein B0I36DRAFT_30955 [Microdochium trichocladiopsis]